MNEEYWSVIEDYTNYSVSNLGNVRNNKRNKILSVKPDETTGGYCRVSIYNNDGIRKSKRIHQLVALAFIPNPLNRTDIDHIDKDKTNKFQIFQAAKESVMIVRI